MKDREYRCSECLELQDKEMESPYVCEGCEGKKHYFNAPDEDKSSRVCRCGEYLTSKVHIRGIK